MEIHVYDVCQSASGGSYFVKYEAEFELRDNPDIWVTIANTDSHMVAEQDASSAVNAIREGFKIVLNEMGFGATVIIHHLVIHPTDFKVSRFKIATEQALRQCLPPEPIDQL